MKMLKIAAIVSSASLIMACGSSSSDSQSAIEKLLETNADIAYASYTDSVNTAKDLKTKLAAFRADPTADNLEAAKVAWLVSREPYGQTEVYRFRNSPIDSTDYSSEDGPEGDINAWPLGEALIDYVQTAAEGDFGVAQVGVTANSAGISEGGAVTGEDTTENIIATTGITINADLVANTATANDEHDVIAGYHAIEFMLWGQDLNANLGITTGADREDAVKSYMLSHGGQRPLSDFDYDELNDNSLEDRRHQFMEVVVDKLIEDLEQVQSGWEDGIDDNYRDQFTTVASTADGQQKLAEILTGMGTLSEGELAGERMQIAFASNSQEDEHSCFSDNTHRDIWLDAEGVSNSYYGVYAGYNSTPLDNSTDDVTTNAVDGYGLDDYLAEVGLDTLSTELATALTTTEANYTAIDTLARAGQPFDVLIMEANQSETSDVAKTIVSLNEQAQVIQEIATELNLGEVVDDGASECDTQDPTSEC